MSGGGWGVFENIKFRIIKNQELRVLVLWPSLLLERTFLKPKNEKSCKNATNSNNQREKEKNGFVFAEIRRPLIRSAGSSQCRFQRKDNEMKDYPVNGNLCATGPSLTRANINRKRLSSRNIRVESRMDRWLQRLK